MAITIEKPTADVAADVLKTLPLSETQRLRRLIENSTLPVNESDEWSAEDIEDFRLSTQRLIEKRLGPEEHNYD